MLHHLLLTILKGSPSGNCKAHFWFKVLLAELLVPSNGETT